MAAECCSSCERTYQRTVGYPSTHAGLLVLFALGTPLSPCGNHAKRCMNEKTIQCLPNPSQHVPISDMLLKNRYQSIFNSFPVIRTASAKKSPFSRTAANIFVSPGDAPAIITQYVPWTERQFNACQTPRRKCTYLHSTFNSFRVIRCLSQSVSPKIAIFTTFLFPLGTPLGQSR